MRASLKRPKRTEPSSTGRDPGDFRTEGGIESKIRSRFPVDPDIVKYGTPSRSFQGVPDSRIDPSVSRGEQSQNVLRAGRSTDRPQENHSRKIEIPVRPGAGIRIPRYDIGIQKTIRLEGAARKKEKQEKTRESSILQRSLLPLTASSAPGARTDDIDPEPATSTKTGISVFILSFFFVFRRW
jgi:hypothetical protein